MVGRALTFAVIALAATAGGAESGAAAAPLPRPSAPQLLGARSGPALRVTDVVRNRAKRRSRATRTRFVLTRGGAEVPLGSRAVPALPRGGVSRRTVTLTLPPGTLPGAWRLKACVGGRCRAAPLLVHVPSPPPPPPPPPLPPPPPPPPPPEPAPRVVEEPPEPEPEPEPEPVRTTEPASVEDCAPAIPEADAPATEFQAMFAATTTGWTGGDGTFSLALPDGATAWLFGDSFIGGVTEEGGREQGPFAGRNLVVVQDECLVTRFRGDLEAPRSFELAEGDPDEAWYWPNQPVRHGDEIRALWTRIAPEGSLYGVDGLALATYDLDLDLVSVEEVDAGGEDRWWGAAFADTATHTYVFGIHDAAPLEKRVLLARTPRRDLDGAWQYRTATGWSDDPADAVPVLTDEGHVSTQLSVVADGTGWALVSQDVLGDVVNVWRSDDLLEWDARETLVTLPSIDGARTYNALVHPQFTAAGELLLSYNVTPSDPADLWADASLYRPRFIRAELPARSGTT